MRDVQARPHGRAPVPSADEVPVKSSRKEQPMLDTIFVVATVIFFAVSVGYAYACDRL